MMGTSNDSSCGSGTRCHCSPCRCVKCGCVVGVYEPLVAVLGGQATHASLLSIDRSGPLGQALAYHDACYRELGRRPAAGPRL